MDRLFSALLLAVSAAVAMGNVCRNDSDCTGILSHTKCRSDPTVEIKCIGDKVCTCVDKVKVCSNDADCTDRHAACYGHGHWGCQNIFGRNVCGCPLIIGK